MPTFRDVQCGHFNVLPYKGKFYKWETVFNKGKQAKLRLNCRLETLIHVSVTLSSTKTLSASPCELHCRPLNENFSEKLRDAVTDGTLCYEGNKSRDMCINGICKVDGFRSSLTCCSVNNKRAGLGLIAAPNLVFLPQFVCYENAQ